MNETAIVSFILVSFFVKLEGGERESGREKRDQGPRKGRGKTNVKKSKKEKEEEEKEGKNGMKMDKTKERSQIDTRSPLSCACSSATMCVPLLRNRTKQVQAGCWLWPSILISDQLSPSFSSSKRLLSTCKLTSFRKRFWQIFFYCFIERVWILAVDRAIYNIVQNFARDSALKRISSKSVANLYQIFMMMLPFLSLPNIMVYVLANRTKIFIDRV